MAPWNEVLPTVADSVLRGMLLALLVLLMTALWRGQRHNAAMRLTVWLCLGLFIQVLASAPLVEAGVPRLWQAPLVAVSVGNGLLFWLFARALFDDDFRPRPIHGLAWLLVAAFSGLNCAWLWSQGGTLAGASQALQRLLPLAFALLVAGAALQHWRADLVESRRRLRLAIALAGAAYTLLTIAARLASADGRLAAGPALMDTALLLSIVGWVAIRLLRLGPTDLFSSQPASSRCPVAEAAAEPVAAATQPADPADMALAAALEALMREQRAYRDEGLSLAGLAQRLAMPEYRLRRLINQRWGHRNFNHYINRLRLEEAQAALADPARRGDSILQIALTAGFQSIGPFNRAFKADLGQTPSEFRRARLADL